MITNTRFLASSFIMLLFLVVGLPARAALFSVNGSGQLGSSSPVGVSGESVTFSFTYDDSLFGSATEIIVGNPGFMQYEAVTPFEVTLTGSVSGALPVDPVRLANPNDYRFDQWNFRSGINGLVQWNNASATAFALPFPDDFGAINELFVRQVNETSLWQPSTNASFGFNGTAETVPIQSATWTIEALGPARTAIPATVPEPATLAIFALGVAALGACRRRTLATGHCAEAR